MRDSDPGVRPADHDRQLVLAFLAGDVEAFSVIAQEHYGPLSTQARRLLGPTGQAEDAVQETFERALKGIKRFGLNGEYRLGPWLGRILSNVCSDQRSRAARHLRLVETAAARPTFEPDVADRVSDPRTVDFVRNALRELPQGQGRAVVLHELDGLPYAEVAVEENISVENARARGARGKNTLRRTLSALRGVVALPLLRTFVGSGTRFSKIGTRAKGLPSATDRLPSTGGGSSLVDQLAGRLLSTPLGQSAWALMSMPPRGTIVFGMAATVATVATVSASTVLLNQPAAIVRAPIAAALASDVAVGNPASLPATPPSTPASASTAQAPSGGQSTYSWVDPTSSSSSATAVAALPDAPCTAADGVAPPAPGFSYGSALGMADALSAGTTPATVLPTTGSSVNFSAPLSLSPFGDQTTASSLLNLSASACVSSSGWFTASITGTDPSGDTSAQLVGVVQEVIGAPGDLGYVFRGTVVAQGTDPELPDGSQFVAQVVVAEPANTVQLTVVFLDASAQGAATSSTPGASVAETGSSTLLNSAPSSPSSSTSGSDAQVVIPPYAPLTQLEISRS